MERKPDPAQLRYWIETTTLDYVMAQPEVLLAIELAEKIQSLFPYFAERPRWSHIFDQASRASQSCALNMCEAYGKGRGYFTSAMMIARGELYETGAALTLGPQEVCAPLLPLVKATANALDKRLLGCDLAAR